ncbi:L-lysine 6-transaminase [bacterium]|nr:L-lysine 6-transaminase [bacterium]
MDTSTNIIDLEKTKIQITAQNTHEVLKKKMLVDGFDFVLDLEKSNGLRIIDEKTGTEYLDFFSFFASSPVGINHPRINNPEFREELATAALNKPSNSDIYTVEMAKFVDTLSRVAVPDYFKHLFFIDGGALAVENGLKVAFDWKVRKNFMKGYKEERGHQVIHFREAFHGRSGYTMSLTNTDPVKIAHYPKFNWPRIVNPKIKFPLKDNLDEVIKLENQAIAEIYAAIKNNPDDIALIIIEPVQGEGGDNFFRKEFFLKLRQIADENEILLMFDEVQTGIGMTGKMWAHEYYVEPDIMAFGKKTHICGIMVTDRIDDVEENVFHKSSRINSTWGGNLTDMVRSRRSLEIIEDENLVQNAQIMGKYLLDNLKEVQNEYPEYIGQVRGLGLMCSFNLPSAEIRKKFLDDLYKNRMIMLGCGSQSVRFRPALTITKDNIDDGMMRIKSVMQNLHK